MTKRLFVGAPKCHDRAQSISNHTTYIVGLFYKNLSQLSLIHELVVHRGITQAHISETYRNYVWPINRPERESLVRTCRMSLPSTNIRLSSHPQRWMHHTLAPNKPSRCTKRYLYILFTYLVAILHNRIVSNKFLLIIKAPCKSRPVSPDKESLSLSLDLRVRLIKNGCKDNFGSHQHGHTGNFEMPWKRSSSGFHLPPNRDSRVMLDMPAVLDSHDKLTSHSRKIRSNVIRSVLCLY